MKDVRCLVKKYKGDFDRAAELGYAINLNCAEGYMWLSLPGDGWSDARLLMAHMRARLVTDDFRKVSEVEWQ